MTATHEFNVPQSEFELLLLQKQNFILTDAVIHVDKDDIVILKEIDKASQRLTERRISALVKSVLNVFCGGASSSYFIVSLKAVVPF